MSVTQHELTALAVCSCRAVSCERGRLGRWLKMLAPSLVDQLALRALKASHR